VRVSAAEKLELIRLVEGSALSVKRTLAEIGLPRSTFYAWYKRYLDGGPEALEDRKPRPGAVWKRIPDLPDRVGHREIEGSPEVLSLTLRHPRPYRGPCREGRTSRRLFPCHPWSSEQPLAERAECSR